MIRSCVLVCSLVLLSGGRPAGAQYHINEMPAPGYQTGVADASNSRGQAAGWMFNYNPPYLTPHAFFYSRGVTTDIGVLFPGLSEGVALNDRAQVAGRYYDAAGHQHGFVWDPLIGARDVGGLGGNDTIAYAISPLGDVVGSSELANGDVHAFVWHRGVMTDLGALGVPGAMTIATGINRNMVVTGRFYAAGISGFVWDPTSGMQIIPDFGGGFTIPNKVSEAGWVVGDSMTESGDTHAFLYHDGITTDLTPDSPFTSARDINEHGVVVGYYYGEAGQHAFQWDMIGGLLDIHPAGGLFSVATAINDRGMVAGTVLASDGSTSYPFVRRGTVTQWIGVGITDLRFGDPIGITSQGDVVGNLFSIPENGVRGFVAVH